MNAGRGGHNQGRLGALDGMLQGAARIKCLPSPVLFAQVNA